MATKYTQQRLTELLEQVKTHETELKQFGNKVDTSEGWATLAIAKAKIQSLLGDYDDQESKKSR